MASTINASNSGFGGIVSTGDSSGQLQLQTANTTAVTIDTSQQVGIGTTSGGGPYYKFHVQMPSDGSTGVGFRYIGGTNNPGLFFNVNESTRVSAINASGSTSGILAFQTDNVERMRIDNSGNVLVGTTSNASSAAKIMVSSTAPQMAVDGNGAGVNSLINWTTSGTTKAQTYFDATNTRFYIACNNAGGVYLASGGTSWTSASDERVKDIIEPIENATEKLGGWRAVIGKYKTDADGTRRSFLIAQDVIQTFPEAVDATNEEELGVSYTDIIPVLVKAIQEQQTIINDLKARIETLESK